MTTRTRTRTAKVIHFDWDTHVGNDCPPAEWYYVDDLEDAVAGYIADVRSGDVFAEPVPLDANAEADMLAAINKR